MTFIAFILLSGAALAAQEGHGPAWEETVFDVGDFVGYGPSWPPYEEGEDGEVPAIPEAPGFPPVWDPEAFVERILVAQIGYEHPQMGPDPRIHEGRLSVRTTPRRLRRVRTLIDRLRPSPGAAIGLDVDLVLAPAGALLGRLLESPCPLVLDDAGRTKLLGGGATVLFSGTASCRDGARVEIKESRTDAEAPGAFPLRVSLTLRPIAAPRRTVLDVAGRIEIEPAPRDPKAPAGTGPRSKVSIPGSRLCLIGSRWAIAAVSGQPLLGDDRLLVLLIRARTTPRPSRLVLEPWLHVFDTRDLVMKGPDEPNSMLDAIQAGTVGAEGWVDPNKMEYHQGALLVTADPPLLRDVARCLDRLRSAPHLAAARVSAWWLFLDGETSASLSLREDLSLTREGRAMLRKLLEGGQVRVLDAAGCAALATEDSTVLRGDHRPDWPLEARSAGSPFLDPKDEMEETGSSLRWRLEPGEAGARLSIGARVGALLPPAGPRPEAASSAIETEIGVGHGAWYLLGGGAGFAGGKASIYALVTADWAPVLEAAAPEEEADDKGLSELVLPLREEEARTAKLLEKDIAWIAEKEISMTEAVRRIEKIAGAKIVIDSSIDADEVLIDMQAEETLTASQSLDAISRKTNLAWRNVHGVISISERTPRFHWRDLDLPSIEDYRDEKDRETFRALARPVEIDLTAARKISDLIRVLSKATGVAFRVEGNTDQIAIESPGFLPPGPKVVPAVVLSEVTPRIEWWIAGGVVRSIVIEP